MVFMEFTIKAAEARFEHVPKSSATARRPRLAILETAVEPLQRDDVII